VFYLGDRYFGTLTALVPGEIAGQFGYTSALTAQILKTLLPQLQPHLYPQPPVPPAPAAALAEAETPPPVEPAAPPPRGPLKEKPDGATSQADPAAKEAPATSGFPEDLEPSVVVPVPSRPAPAETAPAAAP